MKRIATAATICLVLVGLLASIAATNADAPSSVSHFEGKTVIVQGGPTLPPAENVRYGEVGKREFLVVPLTRDDGASFDYWLPLDRVSSLLVFNSMEDAFEYLNKRRGDVSRAPERATERVSGIVTLDGQPLGNATVKFVPVDGGQPISGRTNAQGQYELEMGVAPDNYGVTVVQEESATKGTGTKELKGDIGKRPGGGNSDADSGR